MIDVIDQSRDVRSVGVGSSGLLAITVVVLSVDRGGSRPAAVAAIAVLALVLIADAARPGARIALALGSVAAIGALLAIDRAPVAPELLIAAGLLALGFELARRLSAEGTEQVLDCLVLSCVLHSTVAIATLAAHSTPFAVDTPAGWRAGGLFTYPNALAVWLAVGAVIAASRAVGGAHFWWGATGALLLGCLASGSRAGIVLAVVGVLAVAWNTVRRRPRVVAAAMAASFAVLAAVGALDIIVRRADAIRTQTWSEAVTRIGRRPWLGGGPEVYVVETNGGPATTRHAHNELLQLASEHGLLVVAVVVGAAIALAQAVRRRPGNRPFTAGLLVVVGSSMVDLTLRVPAIALLTGVLAGVAVNRWRAPYPLGHARDVDRPRRDAHRDEGRLDPV